MKCERCGGPTTLEELWCTYCGTWMARKKAMCECEPSREAMGVCVVCGLPVCGTCAHEEGRTVFCSDASHRALQKTHVRVAAPASMFEAEWMCKNLEQAGVAPRMFALRPYPGFYGIELQSEAAIFVPKEQELEAARLLDNFTEAGKV